MIIDLIILAICGLAIFALGLVVAARNPTDKIARRFGFLCLALIFWTTVNYVSGHLDAHVLLFTRLTFLGGILAGLGLVEFIGTFPRPNILRDKMGHRIYLYFTIIMIPFVMSPLFITAVNINVEPATIDTTMLYYVYYLYAMVTIYWVVWSLYKQMKSAHDHVEQVQIKIIASGILAYMFFSLITNLILPLLVNNWESSRYGPIFTLLFVGMIAYGIIKHSLFDIRSFVFRAVVYLFSVAAVGLLYTGLVYGLGGLIIDVDNITYAQRAFFAVLALAIAITYTPIVRFFNKYTGKIFFRDAYNTQEVLDEIGKIIVGNIDLHKIEKSALTVLIGALKTTYIGFVFKNQQGGLVVQDFLGEAPQFDQVALKKSLVGVGRKEVIYDEIEQSTSEKAQLLRKNDISLVLPLITKNETVGYLISGPKKSGNIFNQQDRGMLNIAANELAVALQNAQRFEEIQAFNITLQEKVDEATKELKKTNKKLLELDEAKDEFISMASHQLRTPLTSIKGYISMLMDGDLGKVSKEQDQALKEAFTSSQRMVFLISDFLNVSRIKTGKFVIEPKEVNLSEMVQQELVQLREMAESKQLKMVYEPPADFPQVKLDENKMHQVMMNMMDNAIYYTPNEGIITIQLYIDGKDVVFKVIDTGIGVPKTEQHKLFTKFFRADNARKTRPDGTGLGLFMAQKVVVAQGGSIIFESEEGKGSTFGFRFTLASIKA